MRFQALALSALIAVSLCGCLFQEAPVAATPAATPLAAASVSATPSSTPAPSAQQAAVAPFVKMEFTKSNASHYRTILVSKDGAVHVDDNGRASFTKTLSAGELASLADSVRASGIYDASLDFTKLRTCDGGDDYYLVSEVADKKRKFEKGGYCPGSMPPVDAVTALLEAVAR